MKIELNRDWTEFLSVLIARRVRFVLVGWRPRSRAASQEHEEYTTPR